MKYNPFMPNSIVSVDLFQGRNDEIQFIEHSLFQTKNGNPCHFLVEGERGLGKSSLTMNKVQSLFYFTHFYDPNWPPKTTFKQLVKLMVVSDYGKARER